MRIGDKDILSPQHQLYKNTKDIEYLFAIVKEAYKSTVEISTSASTTSQSNTNVPDGTTKGWLLDPVGNLFSITGVLEGFVGIEFYSNIKGPKGDTGATGASMINVQIVASLPATGDPNTIYFVQNQDGESGNLYDEYIYTNNAWEKLGPAVVSVNIDDSGTSADTTWSSQKTNIEIGKAKDKGIYYTTTQPTSDTTLAISAVGNINSNIEIKANDLIIYIDSNDNPASIYFVVSVGETELMVSKIADYARGGIPTIEINSAQIIDDYNFSFTQAQGQVLFEYPPIINLVLDGYAIPLIYSYDETNKFVYSSVVFSNLDNVKSLYGQLITFNTSTLRGSIVDETFEKPKQLYQHNIKIDIASSFRATIILISDDSNALNYTSLKAYLSNKGFTTANNLLNAIGFYYDNNIYYNIFGVCTQNNEIRFFGAKDNNLGGFNITNSYNIYDNVITL